MTLTPCPHWEQMLWDKCLFSESKLTDLRLIKVRFQRVCFPFFKASQAWRKNKMDESKHEIHSQVDAITAGTASMVNLTAGRSTLPSLPLIASSTCDTSDVENIVCQLASFLMSKLMIDCICFFATCWKQIKCLTHLTEDKRFSVNTEVEHRERFSS